MGACFVSEAAIISPVETVRAIGVVIAVRADFPRTVVGPDDPATRIVARIGVRRVEAAMEMPPVDERPVIGVAGAAVAQATVAIAAATIDVRGAIAATAIRKTAAAHAAAVETSATTAAAVATTHLNQIFAGIFRHGQRARARKR